VSQVASLYDELEERLAASERTQRLQDDLERLDAGVRSRWAGTQV
jgi:hypothetical protein